MFAKKAPVCVPLEAHDFHIRLCPIKFFTVVKLCYNKLVCLSLTEAPPSPMFVNRAAVCMLLEVHNFLFELGPVNFLQL
jgi:hypothetical protein